MKTKTCTTLLCILLFLSLSINSNAATYSPSRKILRSARSYSVAELKKNVEYDFARSAIRDNYYDRLDELAKLIIDKNYAVGLRGHADAVGTFKGNWVLSQKRADAVKLYLVKKGVPEDKIVSVAFGSTIPAASNKTTTGRQKNRRVEIKLNDVNS
ncbi:MAG: hypothetical protein JWQ84_3116 [Mucilaginibacter sp.]|nr:hypothetical protein [Mucilaginibacter sp.]MDB5018284.1 hypothetical protein [Mucilaginibacter sp.]